jgi:hypothetical protein
MEIHPLLVALLALLATLLLLRPRKPATPRGPVALQGPNTKARLQWDSRVGGFVLSGVPCRSTCS